MNRRPSFLFLDTPRVPKGVNHRYLMGWGKAPPEQDVLAYSNRARNREISNDFISVGREVIQTTHDQQRTAQEFLVFVCHQQLATTERNRILGRMREMLQEVSEDILDRASAKSGILIPLEQITHWESELRSLLPSSPPPDPHPSPPAPTSPKASFLKKIIAILAVLLSLGLGFGLIFRHLTTERSPDGKPRPAKEDNSEPSPDGKPRPPKEDNSKQTPDDFINSFRKKWGDFAEATGLSVQDQADEQKITNWIRAFLNDIEPGNFAVNEQKPWDRLGASDEAQKCLDSFGLHNPNPFARVESGPLKEFAEFLHDSTKWDADQTASLKKILSGWIKAYEKWRESERWKNVSPETKGRIQRLAKRPDGPYENNLFISKADEERFSVVYEFLQSDECKEEMKESRISWETWSSDLAVGGWEDITKCLINLGVEGANDIKGNFRILCEALSKSLPKRTSPKP